MGQPEAVALAQGDSTLGITAKITLVEPSTIERSAGKARRVIDKRKPS